MICTALRAAMICQACGLDNKKGTFGRQKFLFCWWIRREALQGNVLRHDFTSKLDILASHTHSICGKATKASSPSAVSKRKKHHKRCFSFCERAVKRCVDVGNNSKKYTRKLLDQLEFDYLFLYMTNSGFSPFSSYEHIRRKSIFATIPKHMPKSLSS